LLGGRGTEGVRGEERAMAEAEEAALEFTPTWIVAAVCSVIVLISLAAERGLHHLGKVRRLWACRSTYLPSV